MLFDIIEPYGVYQSIDVSMAEKASEPERYNLKPFVEKCFSVSLNKFKPRYRKWYQDESGLNWWLPVGRELWHGISGEMMQNERDAGTKGMFVLGYWRKSHIDVFAGPTDLLVKFSDDLSTDARGENKLTFIKKVDHLSLKEIPSFRLEFFARIPHNRQQAEAFYNLEKIINSIKSKDARERMIKSLSESLKT